MPTDCGGARQRHGGAGERRAARSGAGRGAAGTEGALLFLDRVELDGDEARTDLVGAGVRAGLS